MERVTVKPGDPVELEMPASEVMMHMGIVGTRMYGMLSANQRSVQLLDADTMKLFSIPVLPGEAGIFRSSGGEFYTYRR